MQFDGSFLLGKFTLKMDQSTQKYESIEQKQLLKKNLMKRRLSVTVFNYKKIKWDVFPPIFLGSIFFLHSEFTLYSTLRPHKILCFIESNTSESICSKNGH